MTSWEEATTKAVNRYLIDLAATGLCGDPSRSAPQHLATADMMIDRATLLDRAAAEPLEDLRWILENGDEETCARAVGAAWRSAHPFRPTRESDPYRLLKPHTSRAEALLALDQAASLPPPMVSLTHMANQYHLLHGAKYRDPQISYDRTTAHMLVQEAEQTWVRIVNRRKPRTVKAWPVYVDKLEQALEVVRRWVSGKYVTQYAWNEAVQAAGDAARETRESKYPDFRVDTDGAATILDVVLYLVRYVNNPRPESFRALQESSRPWLAPVALGATLLGGLALVFAFVTPDRGA